ncbi:Alpha/beta hydrolase fold-3 domain-containing protein [Strongyloides ratti]|uniref:Alpha/beta hydrolase fold-3 domain-containing protein n=1 Tax=Strongyloides ratti TaxID=34506 RepID=A0A090L0W8_STRRB|nr:Alpha/beta hydrolase fold-3 domain-containing protein [Strongyloides ratti]CEF63321.1 Alpha/beta hydrolase fold-3 domain-containing protein [Strongyloides ratti]
MDNQENIGVNHNFSIPTIQTFNSETESDEEIEYYNYSMVSVPSDRTIAHISSDLVSEILSNPALSTLDTISNNLHSSDINNVSSNDNNMEFSDKVKDLTKEVIDEAESGIDTVKSIVHEGEKKVKDLVDSNFNEEKTNEGNNTSEKEVTESGGVFDKVGNIWNSTKKELEKVSENIGHGAEVVVGTAKDFGNSVVEKTTLTTEYVTEKAGDTWDSAKHGVENITEKSKEIGHSTAQATVAAGKTITDKISSILDVSKNDNNEELVDDKKDDQTVDVETPVSKEDISKKTSDMLDFTKESVKSMVDKTKDVVNSVGEEMLHLGEKVPEKFNDGIEFIKEEGKLIADKSEEARKYVLDKADTAEKKVEESISSILAPTYLEKNENTDQNKEDKTHSDEEETSTIESAKDKISDAFNTSGKVIEDFANKSKEAFESAVEKTVSAAENVSEKASNAAEFVEEKVKEIPTKVENLVHSVEKKLSEETSNNENDIEKDTKSTEKEDNFTENVVEKVKEVEESIINKVTSMGQFVSEKTSDAIDHSKHSFENTTDKISDTIQSTKEKVNESIDDILKGEEQVIEEPVTVGGSVAEKAKDIASSVKNFVSENTSDVIDSVKHGIENIENKIVGSDDTKSEDKNIIENVTDKVDDIKKEVENVVKSNLMDSEKVDSNDEEKEKTKDNHSSDTSNIPDNIVKKLEEDAIKVKNAVIDNASHLTNLISEKADKVKDDFMDKTNDAINYITDNTKNIEDKLVNKEKDVSNSMVEATEEVKKNITQQTGETLDKISDVVDQKADIIVDKSTNISEKIKDDLHSVKDKVGEVKAAVSDAIDNTKKEIETKYDGASHKVDEILENTSKKINETSSSITNEIDNIVEDSKKDIDETKDKTKETIDSIKDKVSSTTKKVGDTFSDLTEKALEKSSEKVKEISEKASEEARAAFKNAKDITDNACETIEKKTTSMLTDGDETEKNIVTEELNVKKVESEKTNKGVENVSEQKPSNETQQSTERNSESPSTAMKWDILIKIRYYIFYFIYIIFLKPIPKDCANKYMIRIVGLLIKSYTIIANNIIGICVSQKFLIKFDRAYFHFLASISPFRLPKWIKVENIKIGGVDCRIYIPQGTYKKSNGAIIYIHGGCWSMIKPKHLDEHMVPLLEHLGCLIVSIDYRLSPEFPFPHGLNDSWIATSTFCENDYKNFDVDPNQIVIMGDSAGGNFAAVISQKSKRINKNYFKAQILIYPAVGCCDVTSPSFQECDKTYNDSMLIQPSMIGRMLLEYVGFKAERKSYETMKNNKLITSDFIKSDKWKNNISHSLLPKEFLDSPYYEKPIHDEANLEISKKFCELLNNPDFAPLLADDNDIVGLPPAIVITCGYDVLRDEGALYVNKLIRNGVPTLWNHYENAFHGIFTLSGGSTRKKLFDDLITSIKLYIKHDVNNNDI